MTYTYNNIIKLFEDIATANPFIKRFGSGEMNEIEVNSPTSQLYPLMWITPQLVDITENTLEYTFRLMIFEVDDIDDSKQQLILSNCLQILVDVIKTFKYQLDSDTNITSTQTAIPFTHRFVDYCTGWYADIKIITDADNSPCNVPGY